ncbi:MAG: efflux RND transporter periplasmic adaptor subunit [Thermoanaerobaculia bacterium]
MKRKSIIAIILVAILAAVGLFVYRDAFAKPAASFRFVTIQRGNLQQSVSATGTLGAVTTVSVGTQVSGQVSELLVDYNDTVKKGQLLARIDPTLAQQAVVDAQANLDKTRAQLLQGERDYNRNRQLTADGLVAQSALEVSQSSFDVARADVKSAQVALDRARQNLAYTNIYAPIDGVVVDRNVQQGQTVAASLSAPQLFLIANDLVHMQILAQVGESDIAQVKEGQQVSFTVQALPNQTFKGTVQQVRLQSTTADNVVNYTVVIAVDNTQNKLLPGMTARVELQTQSATNVLKISNAALRFKPTDEQLAELGVKKAAAPAKTTTATSTSTTSTPDRAARKATRGASGGQRPTIATLYYVDQNGDLATAMVSTGVSDGTTTEIRTRNNSPIREGTKVVAGIASTTTATASTSTTSTASPFGQSGGGQQRPGGGRGGF